MVLSLGALVLVARDLYALDLGVRDLGVRELGVWVIIIQSSVTGRVTGKSK